MLTYVIINISYHECKEDLVMSIANAILGILSWRPLSGYDLKKMFEESAALYWSGNNNEIYRALVSLKDAGLVTSQVLPQESLHPRKIYSITTRGLAELKEWVKTEPELPQLRHTFLIQLAWASELSQDELDALLAQYEEQVQTQLFICRAQAQPGLASASSSTRQAYLDPSQARTPREARLWGKILDRWVAFYEEELRWVQELRKGI
jgi:PadR family transcriptional regulator AphA